LILSELLKVFLDGGGGTGLDRTEFHDAFGVDHNSGRLRPPEPAP
jgi:hypothetical protein